MRPATEPSPGVVVITSGCATFQPYMASALGGVVGGLAVLPSSLFVSHVLKIDDPVDAITVRPCTMIPPCVPVMFRPGQTPDVITPLSKYIVYYDVSAVASTAVPFLLCLHAACTHACPQGMPGRILLLGCPDTPETWLSLP